MFKLKIFNFPQLDVKIWILALGRLLSQLGTGLTLFSAPIFFVNQVGLSATAVGIGLASGSISGIFGRWFGGSFSDSVFWGRRKTLLLSGIISAIADVFLALTFDFSTLIIGNLLMGLGIGLYWPATETVIADLTTIEQRNEAFALTRLADNLGLNLGVLLGGLFLAIQGNFRYLYVLDGVSFILFFLLIYVAIPETLSITPNLVESPSGGWKDAFRDSRLMTFVMANILFTIYISQLQSTLPLYLKNTYHQDEFTDTFISLLFSWHILLTVLIQLPLARLLNHFFSYINALILSLLIWGLGFFSVWLTSIASNNPQTIAFLALSLLAVAIVIYTPSASALVVKLSPPEQRGVYLAMNSQCWAIGYLIGPPLGGWVLDLGTPISNIFWLFLAGSVFLGIYVLKSLESMK